MKLDSSREFNLLNCLQFRFDSIVPRNTNKPERDITTNKRSFLTLKMLTALKQKYFYTFLGVPNTTRYVYFVFPPKRRTKRILSNLKRHLPMKYLGAFKTRYLVFIEYQRRKCKNTLFKKILKTNHWLL